MYLKIRFKDSKDADYDVVHIAGFKHSIVFYTNDATHYKYMIRYDSDGVLFREYENEYTDYKDRVIEWWKLDEV